MNELVNKIIFEAAIMPMFACIAAYFLSRLLIENINHRISATIYISSLVSFYGIHKNLQLIPHQIMDWLLPVLTVSLIRSLLNFERQRIQLGIDIILCIGVSLLVFKPLWLNDGSVITLSIIIVMAIGWALVWQRLIIVNKSNQCLFAEQLVCLAGGVAPIIAVAASTLIGGVLGALIMVCSVLFVVTAFSSHLTAWRQQIINMMMLPIGFLIMLAVYYAEVELMLVLLLLTPLAMTLLLSFFPSMLKVVNSLGYRQYWVLVTVYALLTAFSLWQIWPTGSYY